MFRHVKNHHHMECTINAKACIEKNKLGHTWWFDTSQTEHNPQKQLIAIYNLQRMTFTESACDCYTASRWNNSLWCNRLNDVFAVIIII